MNIINFDRKNDEFEYIEEVVDWKLETPNDIRVKVLAASINPVDSKIRGWKAMIDPKWEKKFFVPGVDVYGEVLEVGSAVKNVKVGDKVLYHGDMLRPYGGFSTISITDSRLVIVNPDLPAEFAAALPCAGWTAYKAMKYKLKVNKDDVLLVIGGGSSSGMFALQYAKTIGVKRIISVHSSRNNDQVKKLGVTDSIYYDKEEDVEKAVMKLTSGKGVTKVLDCVGGASAKIGANVMAFDGEMCSLVSVLDVTKFYNNPFNHAFMKAYSYHQISLGSALREGDEAVSQHVAMGKEFCDWILKEKIYVPIVETIKLSSAPAYLEKVFKKEISGKIVIKIS